MAVTQLEAELARFPPVSTCQDGGNTTIRKMIVPSDYGLLTNIKTALKGTAFLAEDGTITRTLPWSDPDDNEQFCVRVDAQGHGYYSREALEDQTYPMRTAYLPRYWIFTVHFSTLPYYIGDFTAAAGDTITGITPAIETTRFCSKMVRQGRQMVVPPIGMFFLELPTGRKPIPEGGAGAIPLPFQEISVVWHSVPMDAVPFEKIADCIGKVNGGDLILTDLPDGKDTYADSTMNLEDARYHPMRFADSTRGMDIEYFFRERSGIGQNNELGQGSIITWNTLPDSGGVYRPVYRSDKPGVSDRPFFKTDMSQLFVSREA